MITRVTLARRRVLHRTIKERLLRPLLQCLGVIVWLTTGAIGGAAQTEDACWVARAAHAEKIIATRPGTVSYALIAPDGQLWGHHSRRVVPAASLLKTTLLVAYVRQRDVATRSLSSRERRLLRAMITRSDNIATTEVLRDLTPQQISRAAEGTGQRSFHFVWPVWGHSPTTALDQARLMRMVSTRMPRRHRTRAMGWLAGIVPSQRWGIATVVPRSTRIWFKGGWGSGTGRVAHQSALLHTRGQRWSIAIVSEHSPSHQVATRTIALVARALIRSGPCQTSSPVD